jgi:hypothetical protein
MQCFTASVRAALIAVCLAAIPLPASAIEADISGTITGGLAFDQPYSSYSTNVGYAYGRGYLPHLGKTGLYAPFYQSWAWDSSLAFELGVIAPVRFSAANGDYLYAVCGPMSLDESPGTFAWELTFVGGTGRFAEASGSATLVLYVAPEFWLYGGEGYMSWGGDFELIDATLNY